MFDRQPWMQRAGDYPRTDESYFGLLSRAIFSAGLGPKVVEARWPGLVAGFRGFDPVAVAQMGEDDVTALLADASVIRNRRKIEAVVANAPVFIDIVEEHGSFRKYLDFIGSAEDFEGAAEALAERFTHLGPASAGYFLYRCGWRRQEGAKTAA